MNTKKKLGTSALKVSNAVGREAIEVLRFLAALPRAGAGREKTQPFNWIHSHLFRVGIARAEPRLGPDRALPGLGLAVLSPTSPESPFSPLK